MQVQDKVFVVTGAGDGIGRQVALALLQRGGRVAGVDLRAEALERTAALADAGERFSSHVADITDQARVTQLPAEVTAAHGAVDGLVNVAGIIQQFATFDRLETSEMHRVMDVNFWGTVHTCAAFLPHLSARPAASLVNVSSMGGFLPVPGQTVYGASKAAVTLLTEGLYAEQRGSDVAVSIVFPGAIATGITQNSGVSVPGSADTPERAQKEAAEMGRRALPPEEAAKTIVEQAVEGGRYRVMVGRDARLMDRLARLSPRRATDMIAKQMASLLS